MGQSQPALLLASVLAAVVAWRGRTRLTDGGMRATAIAVGAAIFWVTSDASRVALVATRPGAPIAASWTASELLARGVLLGVASVWLSARMLRGRADGLSHRLSAAVCGLALVGPMLSATGAVGLIWLGSGAYAVLPGTWPLAVAACAALTGMWAPLALAANRAVEAPAATCWRWFHVARLAALLALAEEGTSGLVNSLASTSENHVWLLLGLLQVAAAAVLIVRFAPSALQGLFAGSADEQQPTTRAVVRHVVGVALFGLAAKQLAEVGLALLVAHAAPDAGWTTRLFVYGLGFVSVRLFDLYVRLRTGRGVASLVAGPPVPPAVRRLGTEMSGLIALAVSALGVLAVLAPAIAVTFAPVQGIDALARIWPLLPGIGATAALAVRASTSWRRSPGPNETTRELQLLDLEPQVGFVVATAALVVGLVGVVWAVLLVPLGGSLGREALALRCGLFGALALFGGVAAVEYRRTSLRLLLADASGVVTRGPVLISIAGSVLVAAYGVSALVGAGLAPALMPPGVQLPVAQPLACLVASGLLLPMLVRLARIDHRRFASDAPGLDRLTLVWLPTSLMGAPLGLVLLVRGVAPAAAPGSSSLLGLVAGAAGLAFAAGVGSVCCRASR